MGACVQRKLSSCSPTYNVGILSVYVIVSFMHLCSACNRFIRINFMRVRLCSWSDVELEYSLNTPMGLCTRVAWDDFVGLDCIVSGLPYI